MNGECYDLLYQLDPDLLEQLAEEKEQEEICSDCDKPEDESCSRYCWAVQSDWGAEE